MCIRDRPRTIPSIKSVLNFHTPEKFGPSINRKHLLGDWHMNVISRWSKGSWFTYNPNNVPGIEYNVQYVNNYGDDLKFSKIINLGKIKIKAIHTPGHTPESTCYLLSDENGKNKAIFTGDTLFIGDVGRPDLATSSNVTTEDLAGILFDSLRNKILPLDDDIIVYPAHGAGSSCGKNLSKELSLIHISEPTRPY